MLIKVLSVALYNAVITNLLAIFSCDKDGILGEKGTLYAYSKIHCFSATHIFTMILSIISILLYYPAATLIYPLIQYTNKGVDLKYKENFLVFLIQTKLIIAALAIFLKTG